MEMFIDPSRCIGCQACVHACAECDTHRGESMIHLEFVDRESSPQTSPVVCMHCEDPACARVCPADAIKKTPDGIVQSALKARCIGCSNCVLACPFGVPKYVARIDQMMKCDMCYDRTSVGRKPMCVSVCPSGALAFGPREEMLARRREQTTDVFVIGAQTIRTKVQLMVPRAAEVVHLDVTAFMDRSLDAASTEVEAHA
ncbi:MAG: 4Fe-4S ferredoxin [Acidobacteria bacterium]|nr:MAG: 4Fe-4S ferredoxin [Acidobacteriota bacterium]